MNMSYSNYEWFLEQDLHHYAGKWLAIIDKKIVAIGDHIQDVLAQVQEKYPHKRPFITKVNPKQSILQF